MQGKAVLTNELFPIEEQTFEVLADKWKCYTSKEDAKRDFAHIRNRLKRPDARITLTTTRLFNALRRGYTIMPGLCPETTHEREWVSQQVFMLDIDNGLDPVEAVQRAFDSNIPPDAIYFSLSATLSNPRYRMVWILQEPVTVFEQAKQVNQKLMRVFPEADKACKDLSRMYLGGGGELWEVCRLSSL